MRGAVAAGRFLRGLAHALDGLLTIVFVFPRLSVAQQQDRVQAWAGGLLRLVGITLEMRGAPANGGPVLMVSNHLSWLDIVVVHGAPLPLRVQGRGPSLAVDRAARERGGHLVHRTRVAPRRPAVVHHMAEALRAGDVLAVFPEGTTSDGQDVLPFHANLLQAAIAADAPVQPVALDYVDAATGHAARGPLYIGDDTMLGSIWRTLTAPPVVAVVRYGTLQRADGRSRRAWAEGLREAVQSLRSPY